ncbi:amidohydrolase family protein [Plantactinospora endophytica]|uniref:Amidohydrolase-related domain-containing protein n=1 Tax=Plantactinospora endophytica TaxID=673535 RepID=A0ABQ4EBJ1_9ACTN|nr:amidohydrolase family protein [Plantactinospora endophytica]GIG92069.1 hypothetical protein Pen02_70050 [Plantactinospora endophytica]
MYVDVHGHLAPYGETGGGPPSLRDPEAAIEAKRALGIGMTLIGSPAGAGSMLPGSGVDNYRQSADQIRAHNDLMGDLVSRFPEALRGYVYLDPFGGDAMLAMAEDLLRDWRFVGLIVNTSIRDEYLGSPRAADFFAFAARAGVPVLLHPPAEPVGTASMPDPGLVEHVVRPCDITMSVASIVCGGWLERHPELLLIAAAGGGGIAQLAEKLDLATQPRPGPPTPGRRAALLGRASDSLRRFHVETSCPSAAQLRANLEFFGPGRVLLGSDAPPLMDVLGRIVGLVDGLPDGVRGRVGETNARTLFDLAPATIRPAPDAGAIAGAAAIAGDAATVG